MRAMLVNHYKLVEIQYYLRAIFKILTFEGC